jgi:ATP/maltotriose-dependent transcriptional regulator MalT
VIEACGEIFDLRRAQEWTAALEQWCSAQPDLVPYRGHCLIRRAEILQHNGSWEDALEETRRACELLSQPKPKPAIGAAYYRKAEVHRLRGEFEEAEDSYRSASQWGGMQQPGWALLRLAQGKLEEAKTAICRLKDEVTDPSRRTLILEACVEIASAVQDTQAAKAAAKELSEIAVRYGAPFLDAISRRATGVALLAEGNAKDALPVLRDSWHIWQELDAPYEAARVRVLIALACRHIGDVDAANMELAAAQQVFEQLGAVPDIERIKALSKKTHGSRDGLTAREVEILKLIAAGMTNRKIASRLFISEKTVARHVSNIFIKLDLSSRTAATAYAYQHELV